jgi:hypothetical protein
MSDQGEITITNHRKTLASLFGTRRRRIAAFVVLALIIIGAVISVSAHGGSTPEVTGTSFQTADGDIRCAYATTLTDEYGNTLPPTVACESRATQGTVMMQNDGSEAVDPGSYAEGPAYSVLNEGTNFWMPGNTFLCKVWDDHTPTLNVICIADSGMGFHLGTNDDGSLYRTTGDSASDTDWHSF